MRKAKQKTVEDDGLEIPAFLRVTKAEAVKRAAEAAKLASVPAASVTTSSDAPDTSGLPALPPPLRWAVTVAEECGFSIQKGVIPIRWAGERGIIDGAIQRMQEREERKAEALEKLRSHRGSGKVNALVGLTKLRTLLGEMGEAAPSIGRARKAIDEAKLIHARYHFRPDDLEAVRALLKTVPIGGTARKSAGTDADAALFDPSAIISVLVKSNPRREGTAAAKRMALLMSHHGKTVSEFLASSGNPTTLKNAVAKSWVAVGAAAAKEKTTAKPAAKKPAKKAKSKAKKRK